MLTENERKIIPVDFYAQIAASEAFKTMDKSDKAAVCDEIIKYTNLKFLGSDALNELDIAIHGKSYTTIIENVYADDEKNRTAMQDTLKGRLDAFDKEIAWKDMKNYKAPKNTRTGIYDVFGGTRLFSANESLCDRAREGYKNLYGGDKGGKIADGLDAFKKSSNNHADRMARDQACAEAHNKTVLAALRVRGIEPTEVKDAFMGTAMDEGNGSKGFIGSILSKYGASLVFGTVLSAISAIDPLTGAIVGATFVATNVVATIARTCNAAKKAGRSLSFLEIAKIGGSAALAALPYLLMALGGAKAKLGRGVVSGLIAAKSFIVDLYYNHSKKHFNKGLRESFVSAAGNAAIRGLVAFGSQKLGDLLGEGAGACFNPSATEPGAAAAGVSVAGTAALGSAAGGNTEPVYGPQNLNMIDYNNDGIPDYLQPEMTADKNGNGKWDSWEQGFGESGAAAGADESVTASPENENMTASEGKLAELQSQNFSEEAIKRAEFRVNPDDDRLYGADGRQLDWYSREQYDNAMKVLGDAGLDKGESAAALRNIAGYNRFTGEYKTELSALLSGKIDDSVITAIKDADGRLDNYFDLIGKAAAKSAAAAVPVREVSPAAAVSRVILQTPPETVIQQASGGGIAAADGPAYPPVVDKMAAELLRQNPIVQELTTPVTPVTPVTPFSAFSPRTESSLDDNIFNEFGLPGLSKASRSLLETTAAGAEAGAVNNAVGSESEYPDVFESMFKQLAENIK
jgi:hypothetical protein